MTARIHSMTDTWDDAGTTFSAIRMDVTDTASAAGSRLLDLLVGGVSQFNVRKNGRVFLRDDIEFHSGTSDNAIISSSSGSLNFSPRGTRRMSLTGSVIRLRYDTQLGWTAGGTGASFDVRINRDASDILAQRRSTNPQAFRLYNTFTDDSNYERGALRWDSNVLKIEAQAAGTGTKRDIVLDGANRAAYSETAADIAAALVAHGIMEPAT